MHSEPLKALRPWRAPAALAGVFLVAVLAASAVPLEGPPLADGFPLSHPLELLGLGLLVCLVSAVPSARLPRWALAGALLLALLAVASKAVVSRLQLPHGLVGSYWVTRGEEESWPPAEPPHHRRVDRSLEFFGTGGRWAAHPFAFDFVHDKGRYPWVARDWDVLPVFHARWEGFLLPPGGAPGPVELALRSPDGCGLWVDGETVVPRGQGEARCSSSRRVELPPWPSPIEVVYRHRVPNLYNPSAGAALVLLWRPAGGGRWRPVPSSALLARQASPEELARDGRARGLAWGAWLLGFSPLLALALGAVSALRSGLWRTPRARWALAAVLAALVYFGWSLRDFQNPAAQYAWVQHDSLEYETEVRAMLREGSWGVPSAGHEAKAAYLYFLAALHAAFGGNLFAVVYGQRLLLIAAALAAGGLARRVMDAPAAAFTAGLILVTPQMLYWSRSVYPAVLASALAALALWGLARAAEEEGLGWSLAAGVLLALCFYSRPNFIFLAPLALAWLAWSRRGVGRRRAAVISCLAGAALVALAFAFRQWALYGRWFNPQGILSYNLVMGNPVPQGVDLSGIDTWGWAGALGVPRDLRAVTAFALQRPLEFLALWGRKALYLVGVVVLDTHWIKERFVYEVFYFNLVGLAGALLVWRRGWPRVAWLPAAAVALNAAVLVVTRPHLDGFRLVVPNLVFLAVFAGAAASGWMRAWPWKRGRAAHLGAAAAYLATLPFRYGFQFAALALAWLAAALGERRLRREALERTVRQVAGPPSGGSGTSRGGPGP